MAQILIVDDEAAIRFLVRRQLESAGHRVLEAQDGRVALDILEAYPDLFDLIVLDMRMPHMDGIEFLSTLSNQILCPPVIALTAHNQQIPQAIAQKVGGHLIKPFTKVELVNMVTRLLNQSISVSEQI